MAAANPIFVASCCFCHHQTRKAAKLSSQFPTKSWNGLKLLLPISSNSFYGLKGKKHKFRGKVVQASLFGVGAPEALVIGVVALLVFGPKGLAEVARNLGKTLRAFQPTIRELQDVSREFKSTLEREIGLDEVSSSTNNTFNPPTFSNENQQAMVDPNGTPKSGAHTSDNIMKNTLEQLATAAKESQTQESLPQEQQQEQPAASATGSQMQGSIPREEQADTPSNVSTFTSPEAAAQIQSLEKENKE